MAALLMSACGVPHRLSIVARARCSDGSLYAGTCIDLQEREAKHNSGKGAKYTRARRPVRIVYHEELATLSDARRREREVKRWGKARKEAQVRACGGEGASGPLPDPHQEQGR